MLRHNNNNKLFLFNLLPKKEQAELALEEEKDNSVIYAILLLFFAAVIYLSTLVVQAVYIQPLISSANAEFGAKERQLESYTSLRRSYGELGMKVNLIGNLVDRDLNPEILFKTADIVKAQPEVLALSTFERQKFDTYAFQVLLPNVKAVPTLLGKLSAMPEFTNIEIEGFSVDRENPQVSLQISIKLKIDAAGQTPTQN
jgi:hypothetical protein